MSKTGPLCPPTKGTSGFSLPTLAWGRMRKAPPPPDSTITATNFGLTAQNVESHDDLDTLKREDTIIHIHNVCTLLAPVVAKKKYCSSVD